MSIARALILAILIVPLVAADPQPSPPPSPAAATTAAPVVPATVTVPAGTVSSVVDPSLFTHGRDVLHGLTRDPKTGMFYLGVSNQLRHFTPFIGTTFSNDDSVRSVTTTGTVNRLTSFPFPNGFAISARDGMLYVATGAIGCSESAGGMLLSTHCPGTNGIIVVNPANGDHHDFAGAGPGRADGTGTAARFTAVAGIVIDPETGNIYVADYGNHIIRKVTPDAVVTTLAGAGTTGNNDGTGANAKFSGPRGIAYCSNDKSLYVADRDNNEIRKLTLDGAVTTVAGSSETGYVDGPAAQARFDHPQGVACDGAGNIYVADTDNNVIRVITASGTVSTLAGAKAMGTVNGVGGEARFANPSDVYYEASDASLYVIDRGANGVRKVTTVAR